MLDSCYFVYVPQWYIAVSFDKFTYCKLLCIKASAKCPKCKCNVWLAKHSNTIHCFELTGRDGLLFSVGFLKCVQCWPFFTTCSPPQTECVRGVERRSAVAVAAAAPSAGRGQPALLLQPPAGAGPGAGGRGVPAAGAHRVSPRRALLHGGRPLRQPQRPVHARLHGGGGLRPGASGPPQGHRVRHELQLLLLALLQRRDHHRRRHRSAVSGRGGPGVHTGPLVNSFTGALVLFVCVCVCPSNMESCSWWQTVVYLSVYLHWLCEWHAQSCETEAVFNVSSRI